ncbi:MAG: SIR2 family protein [Acidimicrobiales bacterium]
MISARDALATSLHATPGSYAFLLGSGASTEAGVLTGFRVLEDLILRVAKERGEALEPDPVGWWESTTGMPARYDTIVGQIAPTDGARRLLLRSYFELQPDSGHPHSPTEGHRALARLCAAGFVRVVLTTNFDRLFETALAEAGCPPQILATDGAVAGRTPIVHSRLTLVKLHGDYVDTGLRNTYEELGCYGVATDALLDQVLDEYGMVVIGWSAEWDRALQAAMERAPSRRYPFYWASFHNSLTDTARQLIHNRAAYVIETGGATEFLVDLERRIERLREASRRTTKPRATRGHRQMPNSSVPPSGWNEMPLLVVRVASTIELDHGAEVEMIGPKTRFNLVNLLTRLPLTARLRSMSPGVGPAGAGARSHALLIGPWRACDEYNSYEQARYQLGGDGSDGVGVVVDLQLPKSDGGGTVQLFIDMGLSLERKLELREIVELFVDGVTAVTADLPEHLEGLLPPHAQVSSCELHLLASTWKRSGETRDNDFKARLELGQLDAPNQPSPRLGPQLGYASRITGSLAREEALDLALAAIERMALGSGYLDPSIGLRSLFVGFGRTYEGT